MKKLTLAMVMIAAGIMLCLLFLAPGFHNFYWSHPAIFIIYTVITVLCGALGSRITRQILITGWRKHRAFDAVFFTGAFIYAYGLLSAIAAVSMAFTIGIDTEYWRGSYHGFNSYAGDHRVLAAQIYFVLAAVAEGIVGQGLIGLAFKKKR
jgi:hypothetical protein